MNWIRESVNDLKMYSERKAAIKNLEDRIKLLEEQYVCLKGISNSTPVMGGASKQEDAWINNIAERDKLKMALDITKKLLSIIDSALSSLSDTDRYVIELFYINRPRDYKDILCDKFGVEEAQIYRMKDAALKKYTIAMYGISEI